MKSIQKAVTDCAEQCNTYKETFNKYLYSLFILKAIYIDLVDTNIYGQQTSLLPLKSSSRFKGKGKEVRSHH